MLSVTKLCIILILVFMYVVHKYLYNNYEFLLKKFKKL